MKKLIAFLGLAALLVTACSTENMSQGSGEERGYTGFGRFGTGYPMGGAYLNPNSDITPKGSTEWIY